MKGFSHHAYVRMTTHCNIVCKMLAIVVASAGAATPHRIYMYIHFSYLYTASAMKEWCCYLGEHCEWVWYEWPWICSFETQFTSLFFDFYSTVPITWDLHYISYQHQSISLFLSSNFLSCSLSVELTSFICTWPHPLTLELFLPPITP